MKKKKLFFLIFILGIVFLVIWIIASWFFNPERLTPENSSGKKAYYTMVDNTDVKHGKTDERYAYLLPCYSKKGTEKKLSFSASKQLREGAYLELYVTTLRGVTYWQEVEFSELPENVQRIYTPKK
ncbi:hypothetical protein AN1V17_03760 [Vallitalea sediminicola]